MLKKTCYFIFALCAIFGIARVYYWLTDDFRIANITYDFADPLSSLAPPPNVEEEALLTQIFAQPFKYLGKGSQSYAFESEDGKYVLKFFKFKHLKPNFWVDSLPQISPFKEFKEATALRKKRKLNSLFKGYELAYSQNREGARITYLHLNITNYLHINATVIDKMGLSRKIPLDTVIFLLQEKGETLRYTLTHLLSEHKIDEAKQALSSILEMYISEYEKGLYDHDHGVMQNSGFISGRPFHLDVGKFNSDERMKNPENYKADLAQVIWKMDTWIKTNTPANYNELSSYLAAFYEQRIGEPLSTQPKDPKLFSRHKKWYEF